MADFQALSERLRRLRSRHELTQEQFAEIAGISYKFYQQIEAGRKKQIWLETVERLAAAFGLEAWQLLSPDEPIHTIVSPAARPGRRARARSRRSGAGTGMPAPSNLAAAEEAAPYGRSSARARATRRKQGGRPS